MYNEAKTIKIKSVPFHYCNVKWKSPPGSLSLPVSTIHLWKTSITSVQNVSLAFKDMLTQQEAQHLSNISLLKKQQEYATSRIMIRYLLGRYLSVSDKCVVVKHLENQQPELIEPVPPFPLHISQSHSAGLLVIGFSRHDIGIDVEKIRKAKCYPHLEKQLLKSLSADIIDSRDTPIALSPTLFTRHWTGYEALFKLHQTGTLLNMIKRKEVEIVLTDKITAFHIPAGKEYISAAASHTPCALQCYLAPPIIEIPQFPRE